MKKTKYVLALLAVVMLLAAGIGQAMAYFTTYTEAEGGITIWLGDDTQITEEFSNWNKTLTIENEEGEPVFVRAKVFYAPDSLSVASSGEGWSAGEDGYIYYGNSLAAGEKANVLNVKIDHIPEDVVHGDSFNVIVVYESTPVFYREDGTPYADWDSELVVTKRTGSAVTEGGGES